MMIHPIMFRSLWNFRGYVFGSVRREFNSRYCNSLLGAFWAVANPLAMIFIYTFIFEQLMRPTLPGHEHTPYAFSIYLCAGVLPWNLFNEMFHRLNTVFLDNAMIMKKANFPRVCLLAVVVLSSLVNFAIILALFLAFLALTGHWPGWSLAALVPLLLLQILFTLGLGVLVGTLHVFFRDAGQFTSVVLQFWFWLTPIVYTSAALPKPLQSVLSLNPMLPLIHAYRAVFLDSRLPDFASLLPLVILATVLAYFSGRFFLTRAGELVDEL